MEPIGVILFVSWAIVFPVLYHIYREKKKKQVSQPSTTIVSDIKNGTLTVERTPENEGLYQLLKSSSRNADSGPFDFANDGVLLRNVETVPDGIYQFKEPVNTGLMVVDGFASLSAGVYLFIKENCLIIDRSKDGDTSKDEIESWACIGSFFLRISDGRFCKICSFQELPVDLQESYCEWLGSEFAKKTKRTAAKFGGTGLRHTYYEFEKDYYERNPSTTIPKAEDFLIYLLNLNQDA